MQRNTPHVIDIRGWLELGDDRKFIQIALPLEEAKVRFSSEGGSLAAGIEIGKAIRLKQFTTLVPKDTYCASACALAWLGGTKRFMDPGSRIGFHAAYVVQDGQPRETGVGNALTGAYLSQLGLGGRAIAYITSAAPESMQWLTEQGLRQNNWLISVLAAIGPGG